MLKARWPGRKVMAGDMAIRPSFSGATVVHIPIGKLVLMLETGPGMVMRRDGSMMEKFM